MGYNRPKTRVNGPVLAGQAAIGDTGGEVHGMTIAATRRRLRRVASAGLVASYSTTAAAMTGPWVDTAADVLAVIVLLLVPVAGIYLFWKVHILPEIIAEKRQHPQKDAIKALCILSLFFGGLLWPLAWLWAYSKPVMYKLAYGTDKHEDHEKAKAPDAAQELARLRADLERLTATGVEADALRGVKRELVKLEGRLAGSDAKEGG
jgi:Protein of unknown function (DUF3302)